MERNQIKWGYMGAGRIASWFAQGMSAAKDSELYAIGSRSLEKAKKFADEHNVEKAYGSYEELVKDPDIDIIYIAVPVRYHYECIKLAFEAGKHVLAEKSLTVNAAQARELIELAREKNLFFMEAMWTKCQPVYLKIQEWIRAGLLGEIRAVDGRFYTKAGKGHRLFHQDLAGGALLDLGIYPITYACAVLGYAPKSIHCNGMVGAENVDYLDSIVLEYENGAFANLTCGLGNEKMIGLYIQGTKGRIRMEEEPFFYAAKAEAYDMENQLIAAFEEPFLKNGYEYEAIEAAKCLRQGKKESDKVPMAETLAVMEIMDECRRQMGLRFDFE